MSASTYFTGFDDANLLDRGIPHLDLTRDKHGGLAQRNPAHLNNTGILAACAAKIDACDHASFISLVSRRLAAGLSSDLPC